MTHAVDAKAFNAFEYSTLWMAKRINRIHIVCDVYNIRASVIYLIVKMFWNFIRFVSGCIIRDINLPDSIYFEQRVYSVIKYFISFYTPLILYAYQVVGYLLATLTVAVFTKMLFSSTITLSRSRYFVIITI